MLRVLDAAMPRALLPVTACLLVAGCGGRAVTPPATDAVTPAERVDGQRKAPPADRARDDSRPAEFTPDEVVEEDLHGSPSGEARDDSEPPLRHILRRGQTLYSLARMYGVDLEELIRVNGIVDPTRVRAGRPILIPGGATAPAPDPAPAPPGAHAGPRARGAQGAREASLMSLAWPLHGAITAAFGRRGKRSHHAGLDIDGHKGDPIVAAASGTVVRADLDGEYGRVVIIDHGDGLTTLYAHASRLLVKEGDRARAGERIAEVGGSGNARGTHLHFEVRRDGRPIDPIPFLRTRSVLTAGTH